MKCQCWKCTNSGYIINYGRGYIEVIAQECDGNTRKHMLPRGVDYKDMLESYHCYKDVPKPKTKMDKDVKSILLTLGLCFLIMVVV